MPDLKAGTILGLLLFFALASVADFIKAVVDRLTTFEIAVSTVVGLIQIGIFAVAPIVGYKVWKGFLKPAILDLSLAIRALTVFTETVEALEIRLHNIDVKIKGIEGSIVELKEGVIGNKT